MGILLLYSSVLGEMTNLPIPSHDRCSMPNISPVAPYWIFVSTNFIIILIFDYI